MLSYFLRAVVELGLPVAALSWILFYRLYSRGELARDADHKTIRSDLKQIRQAHKKSKTSSHSILNASVDTMLHAKWMKFGGGFYGVAALWTLIVMEAGGIASTIVHPSSLENMFRDGVIGFVVQLLVNQFTTFVQALLWFSWWPGPGKGLFGWAAVAYVGYLAGLNIARHETELGNRLLGLDWRAQVRSMFDGHNNDV